MFHSAGLRLSWQAQEELARDVCSSAAARLLSSQLETRRRTSPHLALPLTLCGIVCVKFASADGWSRFCAAPEERCCYLSADSLFGEQGEGTARGFAEDHSLLLSDASAGVLERGRPPILLQRNTCTNRRIPSAKQNFRHRCCPRPSHCHPRSSLPSCARANTNMQRMELLPLRRRCLQLNRQQPSTCSPFRPATANCTMFRCCT